MSIEQIYFTVSNLWVLIVAIMIIPMHMGFALLEVGLNTNKKTIHILFQKTFIFVFGFLMYAFIGFSLMFPGSDAIGGFFGFAGVGLNPGTDGQTIQFNSSYTYYSFFIYHAMLATIAGTIVSGAACERFKTSSLLIYITWIIAIVYPILGMWTWGGGFLHALGFHDFSGSTLIHSVGGWAALSISALGSLKIENDTNENLKPSNYPIATAGIFLIWLGWFGFNAGHVLSANAATVSLVFVVTALAACAGSVGSMLVSFNISKCSSFKNALKGSLAGMVSICAGADTYSPLNAIIIGFIAGAITTLCIKFFDKTKIKDPVNVSCIHLVAGIWGTIAVGIFGNMSSYQQLIAQTTGIGAYTIGSLLLCIPVCVILNNTLGLISSKEKEIDDVEFIACENKELPLPEKSSDEMSSNTTDQEETKSSDLKDK